MFNSLIVENSKDCYQKAVFLIKKGSVGVIPTDTIYGISASALIKEAVEKVYQLKKRTPEKPIIILIDSEKWLNYFKIKITKKEKEFLGKVWPGEVSVVFDCFEDRFDYLHRGRNSLAFRIPAKKDLRFFLNLSGPVISSSANIEGCSPAKTIDEAKAYFKNKVFYLDGGKLEANSSTLVEIKEDKFRILREGKEAEKIKKIIN